MTEQAEPLLRDTERRALAEALALFRLIVREIIRFIVRLLPALIRLACVSIAAAGLIYGTLDAWQAFGSDGAALIPALLLGVIPLLFAFMNGVKWGGMVASGAFTYGAAQVFLVVPFPFNQVVIVIVFAALVISDMARRTVGAETNEHTEQ